MSTGRFDKYLVNEPMMERWCHAGAHQSPIFTLMSSRQVPHAEHHVEFTWINNNSDPNRQRQTQTCSFDTLVLFISGDHQQPEDLGAEVQFRLADEDLLFDTASALFIPAGFTYGPVFWRAFTKPHIQMTVRLGGGRLEQIATTGKGHISRLDTLQSRSGRLHVEDLIVRRPVYEIRPENPAAGRMDSSMTFLNNTLVPGCDIYLEYSWIYTMPEPNPHIFEHSHPQHDEIVLHIGNDPNHPEDLGAEIEFNIDGEPLTFNHTCAAFLPKGVQHGPLIWKQVLRPHIEMSIVLGAGTLEETDPGGHLQCGPSTRNASKCF
jgi:hypothetical protein